MPRTCCYCGDAFTPDSRIFYNDEGESCHLTCAMKALKLSLQEAEEILEEE